MPESPLKSRLLLPDTPLPVRSSMVAAGLRQVARLWDFLSRPHPAITDLALRRQARLLAGLALALIGTAGLAGLFLVIRGDTQNAGLVVVGVSLTFGIYLVNRTRRVRLAAGLFVGLNFTLVHLGAFASGDLTWLLFVPVYLIVGAIFLPLRLTMLMVLLSALVQLLLSAVAPGSIRLTNAAPFFVLLISGALLLVFMNHRNQLERER